MLERVAAVITVVLLLTVEQTTVQATVLRASEAARGVAAAVKGVSIVVWDFDRD